MKNERGITLVAVIIAVILLIILSSITIYEINLSTLRSNRSKMNADIDTLLDKILIYNNRYEIIPTTYRSIDISEVTYNEIDLNKLDTLSLNYGKEYGENTVLEKDKSDVYVIDNNMNIVYLKGIKVNGEKYYTK